MKANKYPKLCPIALLTLASSMLTLTIALPDNATDAPMYLSTATNPSLYKNILPSDNTTTTLGAPRDRKFTCSMAYGKRGTDSYPALEDCLNSLLKFPPSGEKRIFARYEDPDPEHSRLPQTALGEKCVTQIEFAGAGVQTEESSWLALQNAASDMAFFCSRFDTLKERTGGSVVVGQNGYIKITMRKARVADGSPMPDGDDGAAGVSVAELPDGGNRDLSGLSGQNLTTT